MYLRVVKRRTFCFIKAPNLRFIKPVYIKPVILIHASGINFLFQPVIKLSPIIDSMVHY